jgi:hypothetical protein
VARSRPSEKFGTHSTSRRVVVIDAKASRRRGTGSSRAVPPDEVDRNAGEHQQAADSRGGRREMSGALTGCGPPDIMVHMTVWKCTI